MIYAIADIHGCYDEFAGYLEILRRLWNGGDELVLLGDYIDRGPESLRVLELVRELSRTEHVKVLRGNHEEDLLAFLDSESDYWFSEDRGFITTRTLLSPEELAESDAPEHIRRSILQDRGELIGWIRTLPYWYETAKHIFVHSGVDEKLGEAWKLSGDTRIFTNTSPFPRGGFYKDVISGHIRVQSAAGDPEYDGIFWDGESHYCIDGAVERGGRLLCFACDEAQGRSFEVSPEGRLLPIPAPQQAEIERRP